MSSLQGNKGNKEKLKKMTGLWLAGPWKIDTDRRGRKRRGLQAGREQEQRQGAVTGVGVCARAHLRASECVG